MALEKTGYTAANQGTTKVNVLVDADGNLIPPNSSTPAAGNKRIQINIANADNSLEDNTEVFQFFLQLAGGIQDSLSNQMSVTWEV